MQPFTIVRYGPRGLLIRFAENVGEESFLAGQRILHDLESSPPPGLIEITPAFTTLLLEFDSMIQDVAALRSRIEKAAGEGNCPMESEIRRHRIEVIYDGIDLTRLADLHGLSTQQVIDLHSATEYRVYCLGFSPGFAYLGELDSRLHTPRLPVPRKRVEAGSVAIGGSHTGIYPTSSPGGWNLIGRTSVRPFRTEFASSPSASTEAFLFRTGDRVKFVPVEGH